ncbi:hypothetical protein GCK32_016883 [Trichostrongylus colubriformis]|uniref:Cathepsin propeptide inhibitor domain-containing protein n=1 Tax=Trichostrongylus colubriformis TaxID=6319 RepID=A0AAN8EVL5_TRICO
MTGIKLNNQKEVEVPLQPQNHEAEPSIPVRFRRQILLRIAVALLLILSTVVYCVFLDGSHHQELQKHPLADMSFSPEDSMEYTDRFVKFMKEFGRTYKDDAEMLRRFKIYEKHMREISHLNK